MRCLALLTLLFSAGLAQARVFSFKDAGLAPYFRTTGGLSRIDQDAFIHSSGTDNSISEHTRYQYSGEVGLMFTPLQGVSIRLGAEVLQHRPTSQAAGLSSSGNEEFRLDSTVQAFNPNASVEIAFYSGANSRAYILGGAGFADVTIENKYTMSATTTQSIPSFTETMGGRGFSGHMGIGYETLFTDNVTFSADVGYRHLAVNEFKYKGAVNNLVSPSGVFGGDVVYNADGSNRKLNLGGVFVGFTFRFYLHFI
jgi:hypothetical protein